MRDTAQSTTPVITYKRGQYVLYRNPEMFWTGQEGHTFVCRVERICVGGITYDLTPLPSGRQINAASPDYMRPLPAIDAMRDIDTAPLNTAAAADMTPAAVAWLTQQAATASRRPELPPHSG
ncbi:MULTISPECIES: hypothetical protein [unclassified Streptomyces]|uniref:hypothetical protein n=1 Tax=unclassified Streptomyces TaxID=2593676 RepID=UPI001BE5600D|nr:MULTISPECIES: hypothetical protein [unclassified Streptomyces]MBT2406262.1 hypothetical protein [Streptomyces sp. ISL-21]MBT2607421.1 hypothetical protein [Streptomyces sp. ISL-87]